MLSINYSHSQILNYRLAVTRDEKNEYERSVNILLSEKDELLQERDRLLHKLELYTKNDSPSEIESLKEKINSLEESLHQFNQHISEKDVALADFQVSFAEENKSLRLIVI